jgi:hypothetical protein
MKFIPGIHLAVMLMACLYISNVQAQQEFCGTSHHSQNQILKERLALGQMPKAENGGIIYVPIQIHMLLTDQGNGLYNMFSLEESMCTLNNDFAETGFQFYMENEINYIRSTKWDNHENFDDGIEMMKTNNKPGVVNCYIVTNPAGNCGYFAWDGDAVALSKSCLGKTTHTWAHELGHYFSLPHTFFGWEGTAYNYSKPTIEFQARVWRPIENVKRDDCTNQADGFCETYPDYISNRWNCTEDRKSNSPMKDVNGDEFYADGSLFMSYSNDRCMTRFSADQSEGMRNFLNTRRNDLKRTGIIPVSLGTIDRTAMFPPDSSSVPGTSIQFNWPAADGAEGYLFQLSRNASFTLPVRFSVLNTNEITVDNLLPGRTYYWRVKAVNRFEFCNPTTGTLSFSTEVLSSVDHEISEEGPIQILPNPVAGKGTEMVIIQKDISTHILMVTDQMGKVIEHDITILDQDKVQMRLHQSLPGIYLLRSQKENALTTAKIVVY